VQPVIATLFTHWTRQCIAFANQSSGVFL